MRIRFIYTVLLFCTALTTFAVNSDSSDATAPRRDTDANITGHVVDRKNDEHISYVGITLNNTHIKTYTDATGHYYLKNLPVGRHTLTASLVGYKPQTIEVEILANKLIEINFELEEDAIQLENVVISSNKQTIRRKEEASIINILTPLVMENTNAVTLAQGLNFQPGLRVETNCQNCGLLQVRINGLEGPYSQIMVDSRPMFSSLAGVYGLEHIPANMVERVEVIRGGGSALFSSSAIGGTINIITKTPKTNSLSISNVTNMIYGNSVDNNLSINASLVSDDFRTGTMIFGSSRQRGGFDYDKDGYTEIPELNAKNLGFRSYYNLNYYNKLTFEYHHINEYRRGGNNLSLPPHEADVAEQTDHNINSGSISYNSSSRNGKHKLNAYASTQYVYRKSYYGVGKDPNAYGNTNDRTWVAGAQYSFEMDKFIFMPANLTAGVENNYNYLEDNISIYRSLKQEINVGSLFVQNEWKNDLLSLSIGGRLDKHNLIKNPILSPRINVRYNPVEFINLRAGYSQGFRGPQAFDEDLHVSAVGGEVSLIKLSPDLKPEKSNSVTASAEFYHLFGSVQTSLLVEGFYTNLDKVFVLTPAGRDEHGNLILERQNGAGAVVKGINIEGMIVPLSNLQLQFGATIQSSRYTEPYQWSEDEETAKTLRFVRTPNSYGYFTTTYTPIVPLSIALSGVYTGSMSVPHLVANELRTSPSFFDLTLKATYDFKIGRTTVLQLNAGVQNILNSYQKDFDTGKDRDANYVYGPSLPRTLFFGIKYTI